MHWGKHCRVSGAVLPSPRSEARGEGQGEGWLIENSTSPRPSPPTSAFAKATADRSLAEREIEFQRIPVLG